MPMPHMKTRERNKDAHPGLVDIDPPSARAKPSQEREKTAKEKAEEAHNVLLQKTSWRMSGMTFVTEKRP